MTVENRMRRVFGRSLGWGVSCLIVFALVFGWVRPAEAAATPATGKLKLDPRLAATLTAAPAGQMQTVIVTLQSALTPPQAALTGSGATRQERVIRGLQAQAETAQQGVRAFLQSPAQAGKIGKVHYFWIFNGLSLQATPEVIQALAARADVLWVEAEVTYPVPDIQMDTIQAAGAAWDNLAQIHAPQLWAQGFRGQGVVVANLDTGVDGTHPELQAQWRGGTNSWFDPNGEHTVPTDVPCVTSLDGRRVGHGTATMGVMVGQTVGVAPAAQWVAVKIFDDACSASDTGILQGFEWILNPDGDPATADAPQVVNSSWGGGTACDPSMKYQSALVALRTAGILPVFSAGNAGPNVSTGRYPGTYPEAFPVGATDSQDGIAAFSSRGPNTCVQPESTYPGIVAPGVDIYTTTYATDGGSRYTLLSGTSLAAPHVAGALALLLSAVPQGLSLDQQAAVLQSTAVDLGAAGADNAFGAGRLDVLAAYRAIVPLLGFAAQAGAIPESAPSLDVTLQLSRAYDRPVTVGFAAGTGTATVGSDFSLPAPVTFPPGEVLRTVAVPILPDALPEPDETFSLRLVDPANAVVDTLAGEVVVIIRDDDAQVGFTTGSLVVTEGAGVVSVPLVRVGGLSGPPVVVSVDAPLTGTASPNVDYRVDTAYVQFSPGQDTQSLPVTILDNAAPGADKTFILVLTQPQNGTLAPGLTQLSIRIVNNDPWRSFLPIVSH